MLKECAEGSTARSALGASASGATRGWKRGTGALDVGRVAVSACSVEFVRRLLWQGGTAECVLWSSAVSGLFLMLTNVARNSPEAVSKIELWSLELQRLWTLLNVQVIELRATFIWV